jgi:hypothetical protein
VDKYNNYSGQAIKPIQNMFPIGLVDVIQEALPRQFKCDALIQ